MEVDEAIKSRKSVKDYLRKKPDWRGILEAIDSARYAPMAGNNFSLQFIVVDDPKKIAKFAEAAQQDFVQDAKYVVVVCSNPSRTMNLYKERASKYLKQQAGAGIQNFLLKLNDLGLSTSWVGHFLEEEVKFLLKIPDEIEVEALFPIGYEDKKKKSRQKRKTDLDNILFFNQYGNKKMNTPKKLDK